MKKIKDILFWVIAKLRFIKKKIEAKIEVAQHKKEAKGWLESLRKGTIYYNSFLGYMVKVVKEGGLSLADIGTNEDEIERLRIKSCKIRALEQLGLLRDDDPYYPALGHLLKVVKEGGFSLVDIGTSLEELKQLRTKCYKIDALAWLDLLRRDPSLYDVEIDFLREAVKKGRSRFSLADVGTSEEELKQLQAKGCKTIAC